MKCDVDLIVLSCLLTEDIEMEADDDANADPSSPKQRALSSVNNSINLYTSTVFIYLYRGLQYFYVDVFPPL